MSCVFIKTTLHASIKAEYVCDNVLLQEVFYVSELKLSVLSKSN